MKPMPKGPPVSGLEIERGELHDDRDAESGNRQIIGAEPDGEKPDQQRDERRRSSAAQPAHGDRQVEAAEACGIIRRRDQGRGIGADRHEARDADIEQTRLTPLHVEAEADDGIGERHGEEEGAIGQQLDHARPPEQTLRAQQQHGDEDEEGDGGAPFGSDELHRERFREAHDQARDHGARHAADAAQYGGSEERQQQVMAHVRADLHQKPRHHARHGRERRAEQPHHADRPAHVDAGKCCELLVLAHRAHGAADWRCG